MYNNTHVVGDHILISNFVKYERLEQLIYSEFYNSGYEEINLFIDAYSMIKSVYGYDPSQFMDKFSISSCIINACAHYRKFFWTRYGVTCKIYIVFSRMTESIAEARAFYPDYNNIFITENNPAMDKTIEDNMEILNILCPYIPDVMFIYSQFEPGLVFGKLCDPSKPNIIISKDLWNLQVVANTLNTYMIRPIKKNGEDLSIIINHNNVIPYYLQLRKVNSNESFITSEYLSFIMAATRFPERGMKSLHNLTTIIKSLSNAIEKRYIPIGQKIYDIEGLCKDLNSVNRTNLKEFEIGLRMNAMGFNPCMYRYMTSPKSDKIDMINLHDPDSVKRINDTYFRKVPLDLNAL